MKTKNIFIGFLTLALFVLPTVSLAATYHFVDTSGNLQSVEVNNSTEALNQAYQLGIHSGVMLMGNGATTSYSPIVLTSTNTSGSGNLYQFIDTSGNVQGLWAANSTEALNQAYQLGIHSGVILVE